MIALCLLVQGSAWAAGERDSSKEVVASLHTAKAKFTTSLNKLIPRIIALDKADTSDTALSSELAWLYQRRDFLQKSISSVERALDYYQAYQGIPSRLKKIEHELAIPLPDALKIDEREPLPVLEQRLESARDELETARRIRNEIESEAAQRSERLQTISDESAAARKRQEELGQQLISSPTGDDSDKGSIARRDAAQAEHDYLDQLLKELEHEQRSYENRRELLRARRQQAERQVLIAEQRFNALEQSVNYLRTSAAVEAVQAADIASRSAVSAHSLVRTIIDENQQLATELTNVSALSSIVSEDKKSAEERLDTTHRKYDGIKEKIAQIGLTDAIGLKLRNERTQLSDDGGLATSLQKRQLEMNRVQLRRIEIEDRLLELVDLKREARRRVNNYLPPVTEREQKVLVAVLSRALQEQKESYLNELIKAYDIYFEKNLFPVMEAERELSTLLEDYKKFIDTRILWIQSAPPIAASDLNRLGAALRWLLSPASIAQVIAHLHDELITDPLTIIAPLLIAVALLISSRRLKERLAILGRYVTKLSKAKFSDTLWAALVTIMMALPWPLFTAVIAWQMEQATPATPYSFALSSALYATAYFLFFALLLRGLCRREGLGEAHFRWKDENLHLIRRQINWFFPAILPLLFIVSATLHQPTQAHHDSLGRLAFISLMILTALLVYRLLRPSSGLLKFKIEKNPGGWLARLTGIWFPALLFTPLMLSISAALGYLYTAIQLSLYIINTIGLLFAIGIARDFLIRWLNIAQRKLALEQWRKKITTLSDATDDERGASSDDSTDSGVNEPAPELDVAELSTQTLKLLNSAYWIAIIIALSLLWAEVLPALNLLNEVVLWSSEVTTTVNGTSSITQIPTTLANLLLAIVILLMTFFISGNIPGLLEIAILQRLPFTPGGRYAITTIARYTLVIVGLAMTFNAIGIGWSKVQWLAAAITVGLGFGLQEIFANFVSGLIILFERQIRVGDAVTVGNISGKVSRIQMRATTITDWDRKELIIPNKEFVTGQVINWSLSDTILRIIIPIGIAYGSDTRLAYDTLLAAAHANTNVLDDPEPSVRFSAFGESSLDFELRIYIPHPDLLLETRHELLMDIDQRFREANIEIAFPQRDIHIRDIVQDRPFDPDQLQQRPAKE